MGLMRKQTEEERISREKRYVNASESSLRNDNRNFKRDICKSTNETEIMLKCNSIRNSEAELMGRGLPVYA